MDSAARVQASEEASGSNNDSAAHLPRLQLETAGIETTALQQLPLRDVIKVNVYLSVPPDNRAEVSPIIGGIVQARLRLLGLDAHRILQGEMYETIPVSSPIDGFVEHVSVVSGQYTDATSTLFEILDNSHIHAELMVYERDVHKVDPEIGRAHV